jgi:PAS domain S-box-containing protein
MSSPISRSSLSEQIVNDSPLAIVFADIQGTIRLWNRGAEATFGYTAAEATGQSLDLIIPERHRKKHWDGWEVVMHTGVTKYARDVLAVPALRKDGARISIEFTVTLIRSSEGAVLGAAALIQDVSARWERDKALRARLAELEKTVATLQTHAAATGQG